MWRLFLLQNLLKKRQLACIISFLAWQHDDNKNLDSPYFMDNLSTPNNMSKNTYTKLFKLQFSGASGNDIVNPRSPFNKQVSGFSLNVYFPIILSVWFREVVKHAVLGV